MNKFYLAPALVTLRTEINETYPKRDHTSDGWIGDTSHAARKSDHNPDHSNPADDGVVRATDTDKDGINTTRLVVVATHDRHDRVQYVIWNGFIYNRIDGFKKRVYNGTNKHQHHIHISLRHGVQFENDTRSWGFKPSQVKPTPAKPPVHPTPVPAKKSNQQVAREVLDGKWGNGSDRVARLKKAGYNPAAIQAEVNKLLKKR